ncbi:signal transduction histidine kinase [Kitasatospora sp. GAS204A]|uniref:sensor histidine kinase n=1 Tax=unclassified Kitasatospora TaxID=2633591 RepID=UPI00247380B2|nr:histidine kinase [Kitasatospora sp. GAS204B]MDH6121697.1 signal transduction histidine kinase [Kitasatospora sp. GAS204B]
MQLDTWTRWPSREALAREERSQPGRLLSVAGRVALALTVLLGTVRASRFTGADAVVAVLALLAAVGLFQLFIHSSRRHLIRWALPAVALLLIVGAVADQVGAALLANVIWCGLAVVGLLRLPLAAALPTCGGALASYALATHDSLLALVATVAGLVLLGYLLRLDAEARATAQRLLQQERAARAAEAESAALAERARIAREIHDVLAHSLSAQLVHLEAARLMLDSGAEREQIRDRVVAARRMAQEGLVETKQALSALRGEFTPVGEFLLELAGQEQATLTVTGTPRPLGAEAGLAVRRTAQEALTNVRKHAPRARRTVTLRYLDQAVELEVRNTGAPTDPGAAELAASGSGYGLLGMRERAELLGGSLTAGPDDGGWLVLLRLPT